MLMMGSSSESEELFPIDSNEYVHPNRTLSLDYVDPKSFSGILKAVINNDLAGVKSVLRAGRSPNSTDNRGNTPLHIAVLLQKLEIVEFLLSIDEVSINAQNHYGETPLLISTNLFNPDIALRLIDAKADVNIATNENIAPLHHAVKHDSSVVLALIKNGANLDIQDYGGDTPLNEAVKYGTFEIVSMLLYYGADPSIACENNMSPLMFAIIKEDYDMQEQLIEYETNFTRTTTEGMSLLFLAITHESPFAVELVRRGADIHYNINHLNVLTLCIDSNQVELFKEIWMRVNYNQVWSPAYPSVLKYAIRERHFELFKFIVNSDKIQDVIQYMSQERIIISIITHLKPTGLSDEELEKLIYILLSYGLMPEALDLEHVYMMFGYSELFRVMLHMDIEWSPISGHYVIPNIIYDVRHNVTVKSILDNFSSQQHMFDNIHINVRNVSKYCVHQQLFQNFIQKAEEQGFAIDSEFREVLNRRVPSLLELSRNQTRFAISNLFYIKSSRHFYTYVQCLNIPGVVKDIISFKRPIYWR